MDDEDIKGVINPDEPKTNFKTPNTELEEFWLVYVQSENNVHAGLCPFQPISSDFHICAADDTYVRRRVNVSHDNQINMISACFHACSSVHLDQDVSF